MTPFEQVFFFLAISGNVNSFNNNKPPAEPGSGSGAHLLRPVQVRERRQDNDVLLKRARD